MESFAKWYIKPQTKQMNTDPSLFVGFLSGSVSNLMAFFKMRVLHLGDICYNLNHEFVKIFLCHMIIFVSHNLLSVYLHHMILFHGEECLFSCGKLREMNAGGSWISIDAYLFLAFSDLTCHLEDTGIGVFWLYCVT